MRSKARRPAPPRVPQWCSGPAAGVRDWTSSEGAHELAKRIKAVWAECGHDITPQIVPMHGSRGETWCIRLPQLRNGLP